MILAAALLLAQDWPSFLGAERDGKSKERGVAWPPRVLWSRPVGESFGSASVAGGRAWHFDRFGDQVRLSCFDAGSGKELWRFEAPTSYADGYSDNHGPRCCPVIDGERVYAYGVDGLLFCVRAADGVLLWKKDTAKDFAVEPHFFGVGSTPLVEGDLLLVHVGGPGSTIVAYDKRSGDLKWKTGDDASGYGSPVAATIGGRRRGFVFGRDGLLAFDPQKGTSDFHYPWRAKSLQTVNACTPVVAGDLVFISEAYSVGASVLRVKEGGYDVLWADGRKRDRSFSAYWNTPIHVDGFLYGSSGLGEADLRCVEMATGKVRWTEPLRGHLSLLYVDGRFVGLGEDGTLRLIRVNPERYEELGRMEDVVAGPARAAPALAEGRLYVRGKDKLVCLQLMQEPPIPAAERERLLASLQEAVRRQTKSIEADPKDIEAWSRRGDARFFLADFKGAVEDYEKTVELDPGTSKSHWRRGIAYFYAGAYEKAAKQFEDYHSFDDVDRENGIWRYFSQRKAYGAAKAGEGLLKYRKDDREPFPAVYALFEGKTTPEAILAAIGAAKIDDGEREKRLFYAELYIGLNLAVEGKNAGALPHLKKVVANRWGPAAGYGPAYMWHVGRLHADLLAE